MNKRRNLLILKSIISLWILFLFLPVLANNTNGNSSKRYYFEQFTGKEGLFRYNLDCITQDDEGYIYTCSQNGLHIFNGHSFKEINLDTHPKFSNKVFSALDIGQGKILIGTLDKGLYIYDKQSEKIIHPKIEFKEADLVVSVRHLYMDSNNTIWAGCSNGIILLFAKDDLSNASDNQSVKHQIIKTNKQDNINTICQWNNSIYIGTDGSDLFSVNSGASPHSLNKAIKLESPYSQILSLHVNNNRLWVGTNSGIVILEKDAVGELTICSYELTNNVITGIDSNSSDNIWVGTLENGLFNILFKSSGSQIQQYKYNPRKRKSINSNSIISVFIDKQSNLWIGTWFGGLNRTKLKSPAFTMIFNSINENEIQKNITWCIKPSQKGGYWIGTHANGLNYYNTGNVFKPAKVNEQIHSVSSILEVEKGKLLFVGTWGNGLKVLDTQNLTEITTYKTLFERLKKDRIYSLIQNNNTIWIGTYYNGLFNFNIKSKVLEQIPFNLTENSLSESTTDVRSIYLEGQNIWIG
ncbi:ligand-binding sensor domain-containing protein, partial [Mariniphaga sediminis]|uniref:ligand-binding sensor domain-containing protein n=1 Tax=Mariniphaga sediminis TaxID=1628158 RepID=UPI00356ADA19